MHPESECYGIDVSAPGSSVLSTEPNGTYGTKSGTSMAAPNAAGAAALIWSQNPEHSMAEVVNLLGNTVDPIPSLRHNTKWVCIVDVKRQQKKAE